VTEQRYQYEYVRSPDQDASAPVRHPVVVVGAGPVGMTAALDFARRGVPVVLLDDSNRIGEGSRAICFSKRALEILDRVGAAEWPVSKGVTWQIGKVFWGDDMVYRFDLLPESGHKMPAFINLQQYYLEAHLVERCLAESRIDLRWNNRVIGVDPGADGARIEIGTPDGVYRLDADYVIAADGAKSPIRDMLGLAFEGKVFEDRFLIADVRMEADYPTERWFWFDPPFHRGQSALLHRQPDNVWRIDLQLGWDADPVEEVKPENVVPRLRRMLGDRAFELEWVSIYTFQCRRLRRFMHGRVIFVGDAAHQVSPFGARGANSGVEDAENIAWKLTLVLKGEAGPGLLATYEAERGAAADENIRHSTRSTDFITPKGSASTAFRNAVLALSPHAPFAQRMVNSGRLSRPCTYDTALTTPDEDDFAGSARLGAPIPDAPLVEEGGNAGWLLDRLSNGFTLITAANGAVPGGPAGVDLLTIGETVRDAAGAFSERFDATPGACYLVRPDQHLCARWRGFDAAKVAAALARAKGHVHD
jgi:3-(3-hydroxy-phenyl)propionate hydroxylase